jgi:3-hydroxymyristoyl/3-hydroxydecanoyl-(acyl carrier protein) dehydratase
MKKTYLNIYITKDEGFWAKVGVAFLNKDGSYNLRFQKPVTPQDKLQMRQPKAKTPVAQAPQA